MLKKTALAAVSAIFAASVLSAQPNKASSQKEQSAAQGQPFVVAPTPEKHDRGNQDKGKSNPDTPNWYAAFENPDGALVIVGLITCLVIGWQSMETRRAAKAALSNFQAFVNSERPWISVKVERTPWGKGFNVVAVNKGRTPATILSHAENCIVMDAMEYAREFLPIPPKYGKPVVDSETVLPEDSTEVYQITRKSIAKAGYSETDVTKLESGNSVAYIFGVIAYRDVLGTPSEVAYETRWCCWLIPDSTPDGVMVGLSTQDGYTGHT
jgi:hypothetical protein